MCCIVHGHWLVGVGKHDFLYEPILRTKVRLCNWVIGAESGSRPRYAPCAFCIVFRLCMWRPSRPYPWCCDLSIFGGYVCLFFFQFFDPEFSLSFCKIAERSLWTLRTFGCTGYKLWPWGGWGIKRQWSSVNIHGVVMILEQKCVYEKNSCYKLRLCKSWFLAMFEDGSPRLYWW